MQEGASGSAHCSARKIQVNYGFTLMAVTDPLMALAAGKSDLRDTMQPLNSSQRSN